MSEIVSVVVCCYNAESTIAETLASLRAQTWQALEILVIDDASTDNSQSVVRSAAVQDSRVRLLINNCNRGTAWTRQRGLETATHQFILFLDADDIAEPNMIARLAQTMMSNSALIGVGCHARYVDDHGKSLGIQRIGPENLSTFQRLYAENKLVFVLPTTMFRRADAMAVGGYRLDIMPNAEGIRYEDFSEDVDLWCRMSDLGAEGRYFITIPEPLFRYRKPAGSLSSRNVRLMQLKIRWIKDCLLRRRAGKVERSLADFIASRSWIERMNDYREDAAAGFYKRAGFAYSTRSYVKLGAFLTLAAVCSPKLIRQKIKTQTTARTGA